MSKSATPQNKAKWNREWFRAAKEESIAPDGVRASTASLEAWARIISQFTEEIDVRYILMRQKGDSTKHGPSDKKRMPTILPSESGLPENASGENKRKKNTHQGERGGRSKFKHETGDAYGAK